MRRACVCGLFAVLRRGDPVPRARLAGGRAEMLFRVRSTQRSREVEALAEPTLEPPQQVRLLGALDPFGDDVKPERRCEPQDRVDERRISRPGTEPVDERLRDLQLVEREV